MAQPRPSLTLIVDLDERLATEEVRLEVNRCYSYVGSTLVRTHAASEGEPKNVIRFLVKLGTRDYLHAGAEGADELWNDVMERWFYNELHKVSNNMRIYNRRQREIGNPDLMFDWIDIELQNGELHALLHCDNVSGVDADASKLLTQLRAAYNNGALGESPARVLLPTPASYAQQLEAGLQARALRLEQAAAAREAAAAEARAAAEAAEALAEEAFLESPSLVDAKGGEDATPADAGAEAGAAVAEEIPKADPFALDEADFEVDYRLWLVEYADGTTRTFDSETGKLVD